MPYSSADPGWPARPACGGVDSGPPNDPSWPTGLADPAGAVQLGWVPGSGTAWPFWPKDPLWAGGTGWLAWPMASTWPFWPKDPLWPGGTGWPAWLAESACSDGLACSGTGRGSAEPAAP